MAIGTNLKNHFFLLVPPITGTDPVCHIDEDQIRKHKNRLSVQSYNEYFGGDMDPILAKKYQVDDLPGILLSPRSHRNKEGIFVCLFALPL